MKKRVCFFALLILCLLLSACGSGRQSQNSGSFPGGSGTEADPYLIRSAGDLWLLAECINGSDEYKNPYPAAYYRLEADIDLGGERWTPLRELSGGFDGAGHTISGFVIRKASGQNTYGFFSKVSGTVGNLTISNAEISVVGEGAPYAGAVTGQLSDGTLYGCRATDTVSVFCVYQAGGIAGSVSSSASVGESGVSRVENCVNEGRVESGGSVGSAAGIAANLHGDVNGCVNRGSIVSAGEAGGIACSLAGHVDSCRNEGDVQAEKYAGGICTSFSDASLNSSSNDTSVILRDCVNQGAVSSATRIAAGICGRISTGTIQGCSNSGDIRSTNEAGGIFGYFQASAFGTPAAELHISDCVNSGSITSEEGFVYAAGGIGGDLMSAGTRLWMENCENSGAVTSLDGKYVGGILGKVSVSGESGAAADFINCRNSGEVRGAQHIGGVLGFANGTRLEGEGVLWEIRFKDCDNTGTIVGLRNGCCVGGITGGSDDGMDLVFADCTDGGQLLSEADRVYMDALWPKVPLE